MAKPKVWGMADDLGSHVLVLKDDVFYAGYLQVGVYAQLVKRLKVGADPRDDLGEACPPIPLEAVTGIVADSTGFLVLHGTAGALLTIWLRDAGVDVINAIQDREPDKWVYDVQELQPRAIKRLALVFLGLFLTIGCAWVYFEFVSQDPERKSWLLAVVVFLIGIALLFIARLFVFPHYSFGVRRIHTLERI